MKRKYGTLFAVALTTSLIGTSVLPSPTIAERSSTKLEFIQTKQVENVLKKLTKEQRQAIQQVEAQPTFKISPHINTMSEGLVDVIVEFNQAPAKVEVLKQAAKGVRTSQREAAQKVEQAHASFKEAFNALKNKKGANPSLKDAKITKEYRLAINGVAMTIPANEIEHLLDAGDVKRVWKDETVQLELPEQNKASTQSKMMDSIPQIHVDRLHAENITGEGIKVGVLDTGVDYNHPDLKNVYKGGYDYIDNDSNPMEATYEDWKNSGLPEKHPISGSAYYTEHGTHVAGTIAGDQKNDVDYAVKGVAPHVDLYSYRVLGPYGSGATSGILAGIEKSIADEMDVINLSLGASTNDPLYPTSVAVNHAMLSGVVTVVAAGNSGPNEGTLGAPGAAALGITVGASDFAMPIPNFETVQASGETFENVLLMGKNFSDDLSTFENQSYEVQFAGIGTSSSFEGQDFSGKIALIERGDITFVDKIKNAREAGAIAVILYNNVDGNISSYLGEGPDYIPTFRISKVEGERLKQLGDNTQITFGSLNSIQTEGDHLASFSSRGPVAGSYDIKPDVVAPGVAVFSTVPEYMNSPDPGIDYSSAYKRLQGTSMAAPHVAGVAALILQENPDYSPFDVKAALMNTAEDLNGEVSVFEQGAGRIDAYEAVHTDMSIKVLGQTKHLDGQGQVIEIDEETGSLNFGNHFKTDQSIQKSNDISIANSGSQQKSFTLKVEYHPERTGIKDPVKNGLVLSVPNRIDIAGDDEQVISPQLTIPAEAEEGRYEGYIHMTNEENPAETYQIPFAVRLTAKGFDYLETNSPTLANNTPKWQYYSPAITAAFQMKSGFNQIDIVMKDASSGDAIGIVASLSETSAKPDFRYYIPNVFNGSVYPFTGDAEQPVSSQLVDLPEGNYNLMFIGYDEDGKTYTIDTPVLIDNSKPEVTFDRAPDVYEISEEMYTEKDGQSAFYIHGKIEDEAVDILQSRGLSYDQSSNKFFISTGTREYFNCCFPKADANGETYFGIEPSDIANGPLRLSLAATDLAANVHYQRYIFVQEGTEYVTSDYKQTEVGLGDTLTMTLSMNNVKNWVNGQQTIEFKGDYYSFQSSELNESFQSYASENGLRTTLQDPIIKDNGYYDTVTLNAGLEGDDFNGFDGDMPFLDVTFKVIGDEWYYGEDKLQVVKSSYTQSGSMQAVTLPYYSTSKFNFVSTHTLIRGSIKPEAFLKNGTSLPNGVVQTIGATVYALLPNGDKYEGVIASDGRYEITGVPASRDTYQIVVDVPGHVSTYTPVITGYEIKGDLFGRYVNAGFQINRAGDINDDSLIDIKDIRDIIEAFGQENPDVTSMDVNQDGIVNEIDLRFIEKNFLTKGPDAPKGKSPLETIGKKNLTYYLNQVGLSPTK
ncbi:MULTISPECIES: S8 family serine peptidase [unclassified Exiguobacterium]|uniref:S8 family serine peptidase n=1 Tax=unclassified Exiguobacterium TaxID=2644629 RepID=UPI002554010C|nr:MULTISPECIES: S8 family serine peptidase [unclassified Exiguobacterium]